MIVAPLNDTECLERVSDVAIRAKGTGEVQDLAERFGSTAELARWIRELPQTNDTGQKDGCPRVDCDGVSQRVRVMPGDPNCVERSILYLAGAELLDPEPTRQLATIDTGRGLHTFPVEDGEPVVLDPRIARNTMRAGVDFMTMQPPPIDDAKPAELLQWVVTLAEGQARNGAERESVRNASAEMSRALRGQSLRNMDDVGLTFALAEQAARMWAGQGIDAMRLAMLGLSRLADNGQQRNLTIGIPGTRFKIRLPQKTLEGVGRVAGRVGGQVLGVALRAKLAKFGIPPQAIDELERELNRENLTLGPVAEPPPLPGSLAAIGVRAFNQ